MTFSTPKLKHFKKWIPVGDGITPDKLEIYFESKAIVERLKEWVSKDKEDTHVFIDKEEVRKLIAELERKE